MTASTSGESAAASSPAAAPIEIPQTITGRAALSRVSASFTAASTSSLSQYPTEVTLPSLAP